MDPFLLTIATGGVLTWLLLVSISRLRRNSLPYPPGPSGYPLIGYVHALADPIWETYRSWCREYNSSIVGYKALGTNIIIANTVEVANELLDKRSAIYSDRSTAGMTMAYDLIGSSWSLALTPIGEFWRESRKLLQQTFSPQASRRYRPVQTAAARRLLCKLLDNPPEFRDHTRYMMGEIIVRGSYGIDVQEKNDPYIATAERAIWIANETLVPGKWLVDVLPMLKHLPEWFPGAGFKRQARLWRSDSIAMTDKPFNAIKDRDDLPSYCAARHMLKNIDRNAEDAESLRMMKHIKDSLASVYSAGSDTTTSTLDTFILAMVLFPDIQREAQKAVDQVCVDRLPEYSDYNDIPYVDALIRECLRWRSPLPLSVPHMVTQDDVYNGYFIPAKSIIIPNAKRVYNIVYTAMHSRPVRAMLLDPDNYPEPEDFNPTRFLKASDPDLVLDSSVLDPSNIVFGFGRRVCPGRWLAYDSLWMAFASILSTFDISPLMDEYGRPIPPQDGCKGNFISHPEEFTCIVMPRSAQHKELILAAAVSDI